MMKNEVNFSLDGYRDLLNAFLAAGYEFRLFDKRPCTERCVYLRHDLDFSVEYALPIAEIENELGINSTYFVLMNSKLYNLFDDDNIKILRRISEMGHMICLHVDEYSLCNQSDFVCQMEAFLQMMPFATSSFISRHRPNLSSPVTPWLPNGYIDVYSDSFFKDIEYASDSRGEWKYGYPTKRQAFLQKSSFQLLTHPLWWVHNSSTSNKEKIQLLLERRFAEGEQSLSFLKF